MTTIDRHTITATVHDGPELHLINGQLTLDESWSPFAQTTMTVTTPDDMSTLDPRVGQPRIELELLQEFFERLDTVEDLTSLWSGLPLSTLTFLYESWTLESLTDILTQTWNSFGLRAPIERTADLGIRRSRVNDDGTTTLDLATDEALLQDMALVATSPYTPTTTSLRELVNYVLATIGAALADGSDDDTIDPTTAIWTPGVSGWDYLAPLVQKAGLRLRCDEHRVWVLTDDLNTASGYLRITDIGTMVSYGDEISRDGEWYDAVVIVYKWTDSAGIANIAYDTASLDGYSKVLTVTHDDTPFPGAGAAANVLRRARGHGRVLPIRAVSDYRATPGMATTITIPGALDQTGWVSAVTWDFQQFEMDITTRELVDTPPTAWIFTPAGISWADIETGISWSEYEA